MFLLQLLLVHLLHPCLRVLRLDKRRVKPAHFAAPSHALLLLIVEVVLQPRTMPVDPSVRSGACHVEHFTCDKAPGVSNVADRAVVFGGIRRKARVRFKKEPREIRCPGQRALK